MKKFYDIGTVLQINGKNYEVVRGSGDDLYSACGKCALYGGKPGTCLLSCYPDLIGTCSENARPDGTPVHYEMTIKEASVNYDNRELETEEPEFQTVPKPTGKERELLKKESHVVWIDENEEQPQTELEVEYSTGNDTEEKFYPGDDIVEQIYTKDTLCEPETPKQLEPTPITKQPQLSIVKAKDDKGNEIGGLLVTGENGNKYIIPYGSKVLMDGTCNLVSFAPNTLKYLTPYKDMNGNDVYTGDKLRIMTFGDNTREYVVKTVTCKKLCAVPSFYEEGNGSHSEDVKLSSNEIINGTIIDGSTENVMDWFASVKEALFKLIGGMSEIGTEEFKTIYKLFNVEEYLKKTMSTN